MEFMVDPVTPAWRFFQRSEVIVAGYCNIGEAKNKTVRQ